jgi:hypothetical protein
MGDVTAIVENVRTHPLTRYEYYINGSLYRMIELSRVAYRDTTFDAVTDTELVQEWYVDPDHAIGRLYTTEAPAMLKIAA